MCRAETSSVPATRTAAIDWLRGWSTDADVLDDMAIVVSELVANAVEASPDPRHHVVLRLCRDVDAVVLEVTNVSADDADPSVGWDLTDPLRSGGRGMLIVSELVEHLELTKRGGETTVRCRRRVPSSGT